MLLVRVLPMVSNRFSEEQTYPHGLLLIQNRWLLLLIILLESQLPSMCGKGTPSVPDTWEVGTWPWVDTKSCEGSSHSGFILHVFWYWHYVLWVLHTSLAFTACWSSLSPLPFPPHPPTPPAMSSSNVFLSSKIRLTSCSCSWTLTLGDVLQILRSISALYLPLWQLCVQNEGILSTQLAGTYILFLQEGSCLSPQACGAAPLLCNIRLELLLWWEDAGHVYANAFDPYHPPGCHWAL